MPRQAVSRDGDHGEIRSAQHLGSDASPEERDEPWPPRGADDDLVGVMLVGRVHDLIADAPGPRRADEPAGAHAGPPQLVNRVAYGFRDLARRADVPPLTTDVIALANGQHQHLGV